MSLILKAKEFARISHAGQVRKYTKEEYFWHPFRVATATMALDYATEEMVAGAFLHDVIEDCGTEHQYIQDMFGKETANIVLGLTSYSKQIKSTANRRERKKMDMEYLLSQSDSVKVIKMLDRIDNLQDLSTFGEEDFRKLYKHESINLHAILEMADLQVAKKLMKVIQCI